MSVAMLGVPYCQVSLAASVIKAVVVAPLVGNVIEPEGPLAVADGGMKNPPQIGLNAYNV
jgi:hypothetical protein